MKQGGDPHRRGKPPVGGLVISQSQAAEVLGVGKRTVERASSIKAADPELFEKVKRGEVTVEAAVNSLQPVPPGDAVERQYNALMKAWDGAASEARQRFLDSVTGS